MEDKHKMECAYDLEKKYLTQQEVADLFRVKPATVKNWRDAGHLDYLQPPGSTRVLYPKESVETFERQNTKKAKIINFRKPAEVKREMPGMSSKPKKEWRI
jgi:predicted site-specific integrase-resolvase